ncbi:MAG TPA: arylesterase [Rhizobiales bacterium]|nr:arylesterase [Hyphomicrobiales bacterium]
MALVCTAILFFCLSGPVLAGQNIVIAAFGDSLTAGYQLSREDAFPARLEQALRARGYHVRVLNAGVSGDTTGDALARLDWTLGENVDAVIVEFGANDALRGLAPSGAKKNLDAILTRLAKRRLPVLLVGMAAPRNLGAAYGAEFNRIYPELARRHKVILFPFFLDGVITVRENLLADGLHPNPRGVAQIVQNILPYVEKLIRAIPRP